MDRLGRNILTCILGAIAVFLVVIAIFGMNYWITSGVTDSVPRMLEGVVFAISAAVFAILALVAKPQDK